MFIYLFLQITVKFCISHLCRPYLHTHWLNPPDNNQLCLCCDLLQLSNQHLHITLDEVCVLSFSLLLSYNIQAWVGEITVVHLLIHKQWNFLSCLCIQNLNEAVTSQSLCTTHLKISPLNSDKYMSTIYYYAN